MKNKTDELNHSATLIPLSILHPDHFFFTEPWVQFRITGSCQEWIFFYQGNVISGFLWISPGDFSSTPLELWPKISLNILHSLTRHPTVTHTQTFGFKTQFSVLPTSQIAHTPTASPPAAPAAAAAAYPACCRRFHLRPEAPFSFTCVSGTSKVWPLTKISGF